MLGNTDESIDVCRSSPFPTGGAEDLDFVVGGGLSFVCWFLRCRLTASKALID